MASGIPFALVAGEQFGEAAAFVRRQGAAECGGERFEQLGVTRFRFIGANPGANRRERRRKRFPINRLQVGLVRLSIRWLGVRVPFASLGRTSGNTLFSQVFLWSAQL